jgi:hypothetical protein
MNCNEAERRREAEWSAVKWSEVPLRNSILHVFRFLQFPLQLPLRSLLPGAAFAPEPDPVRNGLRFRWQRPSQKAHENCIMFTLTTKSTARALL